MGCGGSTAASKDDPSRQVSGEAKCPPSRESCLPDDILDVEEDYPPPEAPPSSKNQVFQVEEYQDIDERCKKAPPGVDSSYSNLIGYLTEGATSDLQKARAIFIWLGSQRIYEEDFEKAKNGNTPRGYMKLIQEKNGNYATFFALLCRAAGIPCVIIRGYGKSAQYEAGDRDLSSCLSSWNAVHVDGAWRLVHPLWAFTAVTDADGNTREGTDTHEDSREDSVTHEETSGPSNKLNRREGNRRIQNRNESPSGRTQAHGMHPRTNRNDRSASGYPGSRMNDRMEARSTERNKRNYRQQSPRGGANPRRVSTGRSPTTESTDGREQGSTGPSPMAPQHQAAIDEDYFLTDPEHFIHLCRPFREEWQLLADPWTMNEFLSVPYFQMAYFRSGLELVSSRQCRLSSEGGLCRVSFRVPPGSPVVLRGSLLFNKAESTNRLPDDVYLSQHVIVSVEDDVRTLIARLPVKSIYKLSIFGGAEGKEHLCDFRLQCAESIHRGQPFPFQPEVGIGYGEAARAAGLSSPSHAGGILTLRPRESEELIFKSRDQVELRARMVHGSVASESLSNYVSAGRVGKEIRVWVAMPDPLDFATEAAEFGVELQAREGGGDFHNVLNYLVTVDGIEARRRNRQMLDTHPARVALVEATEQGSIPELEAAIRRFQRETLQDGGDLQEAKEKLLYLHRVALADAIEGRNLEELEDVIHRAESSAVLGHLRRCWELPEAERTRDQLRRLKYFLHRILELNQQTISEVHRYQTPPPAVHDVMQATYLLLGEREENVAKWSYVQKLMRRTGKRSLIRRVQDFDVVRVNLSDAIRASWLLEGYDQFSVHQASAGAGAFHVWCCSVIDEIQEQEAENLHSHRSLGSPHSGESPRALSALPEEEEGEGEEGEHRRSSSPAPPPAVASPPRAGGSPALVSSSTPRAAGRAASGQASGKGDNSREANADAESDMFASNFDGSPREDPKVDVPKRSPREEHYYAG